MTSGRKILFPLILLIFIYLCIEIASFGVYSLKKGTVFSFDKIANEKEAVANIDKTKIDSNYAIPGGIGTRVIHPYMGFVYEPGEPLYNIAVQPKKLLNLHSARSINMVLQASQYF